jgi:hypothetical protein
MVEDQRRDIAGMSVAVAHEATALGRFIHGGFEHPKVLFRTAEREDRLCMDALTVASLREEQKLSMGYVLGISPL